MFEPHQPQAENGQLRKSQIRYATQLKNGFQNSSEGNFAPQVNLLQFFKQRSSVSKPNLNFPPALTPKPKASIHLKPIKQLSTPQQQDSKKVNLNIEVKNRSDMIKEYCQKDLLAQEKQKSQKCIIERSDNSESEPESGESVVWDNDELKMRGLELNKQRQSKAAFDHFSDLYKYRYESFPQRRSNISFQRVFHIAKVYANSNTKSQKKYHPSGNHLNKPEIDFSNPYNPFQDKNFKDYNQYVNQTQKRPRKLKKLHLPNI